MSFQRRKILKALLARGCRVIRDTGPHTVVIDPAGRRTTVPRHHDVNRNTTRSIAKALEIDPDVFLREVR